MTKDIFNTSNKMDDLSQCLTESCERITAFKNADNFSRLKMLKDLNNVISNKDFSLKDSGDDGSLEAKNILFVTENVLKFLTHTLTEGNEKCRETSVTVLKSLFDRCAITESMLPPLLKVLSLKLGKTDEREPSEEVRILELDLLLCVIEKYNGDLLSHLSDISSVLKTCIVDDCPDVKRKSCECVILLAINQKSHFHMVGGNFLNPLLHTISHQHLKTRVICVKAIGSIADFVKGDEFDQMISHLAQRLFDRSPLVRMAVAEVVGEMLIALKDRYSYFHRLIPLALSALYDHVEELRSKALVLWKEAGDRYMAENESDYKDLLDYPPPNPVDYPVTDGRPSLGCRILVQRNAYNIAPALLHDITDWVPETRIKTAMVMYSLILHSEEKITIQLPSILEGILSAAKDQNNQVIKQARNCAELLGYFIDINLLCDSLLCLIHKNVSSSNLDVLAAVIRGRRGPLPSECFVALCKFLSTPEVCRMRQAAEQISLLSCVEGLLSSNNNIDCDISYNLFTVLISVAGLSTTGDISLKAEELLEVLAKSQTLSKSTLFKQNVKSQIDELSQNNELWTFQSPEMPIFSYIIESGHFDEEIILSIFSILTNNLHHSKDAKIRGKALSLLIPVFQKLSPALYESLSKEVLDVIRLGLFPNLIWTAGKTASKLRTVAAASLFEVINKSSSKKKMLSNLGEEMLPILTSLTEDDETTTKIVACKTLELVLPHLVGSVDDLKIHKVIFDILHCMEDESDDVRIMTVRILTAYVKSFPNDYDWRSHKPYMKHIFENVLIHMDDRSEKIRQSVYAFLKEASFTAPDVLIEEIESKKYDMSNSDLSDSLVEHIKLLKL